MDTSLNIVDLIENNTVLNLSPDYNNRFINKVKETFTETQQQMFVSSFYCYLNYHQTNDFVIDLDNIWKWLGFSQKAMAKRSLEKYFTIDKDYKVLLCRPAEQTNDTKGGHNKQIILLNIRTFKLFCIKAGTEKANEIHEYFIKLEDIMNEIIKEECAELKEKIENQKISNKLEKELLREKTLIEQFPVNTQCVYYGLVDNTNEKNEQLIKYGNSNNLQQRVEQHKKIYTNFRLVNAFKVENKLHIENTIKNCEEIIPYKRVIEIKNVNYTELLCINNLSFDKLDAIIKNIITTIEYSPENYVKLLHENKELKTEIAILKEQNKKLKQKDNLLNNTKIEPTESTETNVKKVRRFQKHKDNFYYIDCKKYEKLFGTRQEVWDSIAYMTSGQLIKEDLVINHSGKIVSKIKSEENTNNPRGICMPYKSMPHP
jgi:cell division septum initiation protein DivIVA